MLDSSSVKVYTVNGAAAGSSSSLPDWLTRKRQTKGKGKRSTRETVEGTIELIQHFDFPEASNRVKTTRDGHHAVATGTYKPQMKVWDLDQLSLKFERHSDSENVDFLMLSDDWTKSLHLQNDRTVELHAQGGLHYKTRIPRFGRCVGYHFPSCDALVAGAGNEVYRLNLEQGRFLSPLSLTELDGSSTAGVNALDINPAHQLLALGAEETGAVHFWDLRSRTSIGHLQLPVQRLAASGTSVAAGLTGVDEHPNGRSLSVTALASRSDGLSYAVGTLSGHTLLYDIRSAKPFAIKDQGYGLPVKHVTWIDGGSRMAGDGLVLSADSKVVKIWDRNTPTSNFVSITPATDLNDVHHVPGSGLLLCANEGVQMSSFFVPQLGPAPRWCSFLENITEEMEDSATRSVYEDYKFVSRAELAKLGLDHLVGTPALKPYLHGYFISLKLYDTARLIANPFAYEEHRARVVQEKIDALAESRIRARKNATPSVKVNKALADRVQREAERAARREERKKRKRAAAGSESMPEDGMDVDAGDTPAPKADLFSDPRFSALFENPEFEVDETSREFSLMNPSLAAQRANGTSGQAGGRGSGHRTRTAVEEEEDESDKMTSDGLSDSEEESDDHDASDDSSDAGDLDPRTRGAPQSSRPAIRRPLNDVRLVPVRAHVSGGRAGRGGDANASFGQRRGDTAMSNGRRKKRTEDEVFVGSAADGGLEMSWTPTAASAKRHAEEDRLEEQRARKAKTKGKEIRGSDRRQKGVETFGVGMQKGLGHEERETVMTDGDRHGRKQRRHGIRSGSKNAIFGRS